MKRHLIALIACVGMAASSGGALAAGSGCLGASAKLDGAGAPSTPVPADAGQSTSG